MTNTWLKIKIWTKGICAGLVLLYLLIFIYQNNRTVPFWWWSGHQGVHSVLLLILIAFFAGVISTVLVRTTLRTLKQIRDMRSRARTDRMERDLNEMKLKASRLQTKSPGGNTTAGADSAASMPPDEASH